MPVLQEQTRSHPVSVESHQQGRRTEATPLQVNQSLLLRVALLQPSVVGERVMFAMIQWQWMQPLVSILVVLTPTTTTVMFSPILCMYTAAAFPAPSQTKRARDEGLTQDPPAKKRRMATQLGQ